MRDAAPAATRRRAVVLLAIVLFLNYVDRGALPIAAQRVQVDLGLTRAQLGLLLSAFFWTYALMQIPAGWLAERWGAQRVLAAGLALWALSTAATGLVGGFGTLLVLRLLLGVGESAGFPCTSKLLASLVEVRELGTANGVVALAYLTGPAVGIFAGGWMIEHYGWRAMFMVFGGLSLLWLWPWAGTHVPPLGARQSGEPTFRRILGNRALWGAGLGHFTDNYTYYFVLSWLPYYLERERGFSASAMQAIAGSAFVVNAACAMLAGWAIDRHVARGGSINLAYKSVMVVTHLGAVGCMLGVALGSQSIAVACIFVYQALCGAASPGVFAISQILAGPAAAGRWVGVQNTLGNLAGIVAPEVTGLLADRTGHFTAAFVVAAGVSLLGILGWACLIPRLGERDVWGNVSPSSGPPTPATA